MGKVSPLEAAMQAIDLLRDVCNSSVPCMADKNDPSPSPGCECFVCRLRRKASNIVDRYDGEEDI